MPSTIYFHFKTFTKNNFFTQNNLNKNLSYFVDLKKKRERNIDAPRFLLFKFFFCDFLSFFGAVNVVRFIEELK